MWLVLSFSYASWLSLPADGNRIGVDEVLAGWSSLAQSLAGKNETGKGKVLIEPKRPGPQADAVKLG